MNDTKFSDALAIYAGALSWNGKLVFFKHSMGVSRSLFPFSPRGEWKRRGYEIYSVFEENVWVFGFSILIFKKQSSLEKKNFCSASCACFSFNILSPVCVWQHSVSSKHLNYKEILYILRLIMKSLLLFTYWSPKLK